MIWYLLQCKPNQQSRAQEHLNNQGFVIYSPEIRAERVIRRRRVVRAEAVFPGYLFIQLSESSNWRALHATRGISRLVGFNGIPHPVPEGLIQNLIRQYDKHQAPVPLYQPGDQVQIAEGCFKNIEAIVAAVTADDRIIVLLNILHSEQAVAFTANQLAKVS